MSSHAPVSTELQSILDLEKFIRGKVDRLDHEIAAEEDAYLRQFPTGNLIQGWDAYAEGRAPEKRRPSDRIFSGSSSTFVDHSAADGRGGAAAAQQARLGGFHSPSTAQGPRPSHKASAAAGAAPKPGQQQQQGQGAFAGGGSAGARPHHAGSGYAGGGGGGPAAAVRPKRARDPLAGAAAADDDIGSVSGSDFGPGFSSIDDVFATPSAGGGGPGRLVSGGSSGTGGGGVDEGGDFGGGAMRGALYGGGGAGARKSGGGGGATKKGR